MSYITSPPGEMPKQTDILEMDKCISSRLWFTSLSVDQVNNESGPSKEFSHICCLDLMELEATVESLIHSPSEEQYQWIAYVLLRKLVDRSSNVDCSIQRNIQIQLDYIQMRNALELCGDVPDYVYKELLMFLRDASVKHNEKGISNIISQQTITFLKQSLHSYPRILCWIINKLISAVPNIRSVVNDLRDIYFSVLKSCLKHIPVRRSWRSSYEALESCSPENTVAIRDNHLPTILCLLSQMDINIDVEAEFLKTIYSMLTKACDVKDIELALYSRKDEKLFGEWLSFWNEIHACSASVTSLDAAYNISKNIFQFAEDSEIRLCKRELLKRISARKLHWLNDVLDICYVLTMNRKYNEVELLFSCDLLKRLYPVLLLKALNECPQEEVNSLENCDKSILICESIKFLLEKCYADLHSDYDLNKLHILLKNQIKIVEYILHWKRRYFIEATSDVKESKNVQSDTNEQIISMKGILSLLQERNVLSVLKITTNIHDQDHAAIKNVLTESNESKNFQAYCSVISALKVILLCEYYNTEYEQIAKYFADMVAYLSSVFPMSLRIETMANIFSLLFLRYEDFTDANTKDDTSYEKANASTSVECDVSSFIANKYAIRDALHYLWESMLIARREIERMHTVKDSAELYDSLSMLNSAFVDARWRLRFYMRPNFVENVGVPQDEFHNSSATSKLESMISQKSNLPRHIKDNTFFYNGDSTSDETKIKSDSGTEPGLPASNVKRRKRSRNATPTADVSMTKDRSSLINLMLASKENLVLHCLWRSDLQKAQEVIKMFHMENTQLDSEVRFSEALRTFKQDTFKYIDTLDTTDCSKGNSKTSTLENIRLVAQEGVQSSRHTNQIETFLASQELYLRTLDTDILSSNEMLTVSVLDLSLTIGQTYQISNNLCDVAMKYLKLCKTFDKTEHANFFLRIYQLFYESKSNMSVTTILCDVRSPLSIKEWKENNIFWNDLEHNYRAFNDAEKAEIVEKQSHDDNRLLGLKPLRKISTIHNSDQKYLQNIYSHLQLVSTIIPDSRNSDVDIRTMTDLLKTSLHRYFGYQIFDLQTDPDKLETVASDLQVNLVYSILVNAYPNISCYNEKSHISNIKSSDCIILNQNQDKSDAKHIMIKGPNQCISEILMELLQILRKVSSGQSHLNHSRLRNISQHTDVQSVLNKTSSLATLDLSELSVGNETLTFFLNVWNVMFLHACLTVWCNDPPFDRVRHTVSLISVGYIIGDLGLVTLAALRSKLLGNLANDFDFFTRVEELNELAWQDLDLVHNPKVIFAMANEFYGTPEIRVYETQTLNKNLDDAERDYICHYSSRSPDEESADGNVTRWKISLPDLVRQYRNTLSRNDSASTTVNANEDLPLTDLEILNEDMITEYIASNYTYEVILKYFERNVPLVKTADVVEISLWQTRRLRPNLLRYLEEHCWLLSYLLQRMHNENPIISKNTCDNTRRTACFENLLSSPWVDKLKSLFNDNQTLTAIHDNISIHELWAYFELERKNCNWEHFLDILNALPDNIMRCNTELLRFKDLALSHMLSNPDTLSDDSAMMLQCLYQIKNISVLARTILHNVKKWPMNVCEHALLHVLQHNHSYKLPVHCKQRMNGILCRIMIFHKMIPYCVSKSNSTWYDVMYCTKKIDPFQIIKSLINADQFELCLEWLECQAFSLEIQPSVIQDFLFGLLRNDQQNFNQALKFLRALPLSQSVKVCKGVLKKPESTSTLQFVTNYLLEHCKVAEKPNYRRTLVGVEILKMLESKEKMSYAHLIKEPLLMLEQLLMNCKFESIQRIKNALYEDLQHSDVDISNFDKIIRFYAKKSLDFRVALHRDGTENKARDVSRFNLVEENNEFVMPVNVPTKEEWIPNDKAKECSCCKAVIFSMFNRRHHCRRCGRVVCAICSQHRMQVTGYPASMLLRVCNDCKRQTILQMQAVQNPPSTTSSEIFDYWRLTRDERHNRTIREDFSFEHAPNISLCLAILNLHSDHKMYTSFLLDRCDEMKQLLQPVNGGRINPEIDHAVIIKMIRSLLIAAKVKCAKLGFNTGLAHCDRFLSQVDLIATLIQSDCLTLIPTDDLDEHTLRKLRDLLTEKEQWILALDVSTKAGLDKQGVWAAWGKACLKVGYFDQAREKFYHCFDKIVHEEFDDWVVLTYIKEPIEENKRKVNETTPMSKRSKTTSDEDEKTKRNEFSKCRPLKDPPLLTEILQILDDMTVHRSRGQHHSLQSKSDAAQEILQTLNSLKAVSQNQFNMKHLAPVNQTIYYQENLYYLLAYGSYNSILYFFLKHREFDKCLKYILENDIECDLFLNGVYLRCLKNGETEHLHDAMRANDSTLLVWRKYLMYVCHFMERKQYWHVLYQIQLYMRDYVRASMTCIRFYINEANTYTDLHNKVYLLQDAQKHLESELQIESLNKRRKSTTSMHSGHSGVLAIEMEPSEIDRHINTICRQSEIAKFLANSEKEERAVAEFLNLFPDVDSDDSQIHQLPTLFGDQQQKIHLAVLAILCGRDIEEGFGIAFRIMQDYNLPQQKVYSLAGHVLALKNNVPAIEQLIKCCRNSGAPKAHVISDHVLTHCVKLLLNRSYSEQDLELKNHIDMLVRSIIDTELRINAYIESKQLKAAYLLAVKHSRAQDIRRILKESDRLGQNAIKAICLKWLQQKPKE